MSKSLTDGIDLQEQFKYHAISEKRVPRGLNSLSLKQTVLWFKEARIIDDKRVTSTDVTFYFNKAKQATLNYTKWLEFLKDFAEGKLFQFEELKEKLLMSSRATLQIKSARNVRK